MRIKELQVHVHEIAYNHSYVVMMEIHNIAKLFSDRNLDCQLGSNVAMRQFG